MTHRAVVDPIVHATHLDLLSLLIFLLLFAVVLTATLRAPRFGLVALVATDPFALSRYVGSTTITLGKVALVAAALALILRAIRGRTNAAAALVRQPLAWCALAIIVASALSMRGALDHGSAIRETLKALQYALTFAVAFIAREEDDDDRLFFAATSIVAIIVSVLAIAQLITGAPSGLWIGDKAIPRIAGPLEGPNQLAAYFDVVLPLLVARLAFRRSTIVAAAVGVVTCALVLSLSRSGILTAVLGVAVVLFLAARPFPRRVVVVPLAGALAGAIVLGVVGYYYTRSNGALTHLVSTTQVQHPGTVGTRRQLWHGALVLWRAHPIFGIGAGNFENEVGGIEHADIRTHANSWYLQSLVEGGIPLFLATIATAFLAVATFARAGTREPLVIGALGGSVALVVHQVVDYLVFYPKVGVEWWLVLGAAAACVARSRSS